MGRMHKAKQSYFEGRWTAAERRIVRQAINRVEGRRPGTARPLPRPSWLCIRRGTGRDVFYFAYRIGWPTSILVACSATELGKKIATLAAQRNSASRDDQDRGAAPKASKA